MSDLQNSDIDLQQLIEHARRNERIARTLFDIEVEVMNLADTATFMDRLTDLVRERFGLDDVWLVLTDIEDNGRLRASLTERGALTTTVSVPTVDFMRLLANSRDPVLVDRPQRYTQLIPTDSRGWLGSMAVLPLIMEGRVVGALVLGSRNGERYHPDMASFFLQQLAVKVSIGLSSVWAREQLRQLATRDPLTGLRNRREMDDCLQQELSRARRYGHPLSLLFIDCDDFKRVNDSHGHDCGDAYLCFIAHAFQRLLRGDDSVFRFAGDEFVVLLPNQNLQMGEQIAQRLQEHFDEALFHWREVTLKGRFSHGLASTEEAGLESAEALLRAADQRLYRHKQARKSQP